MQLNSETQSMDDAISKDLNPNSHLILEKENELSVQQILQIYIKNWPLFISLFILVSIFSAIYYYNKIPFISESFVNVNDAHNSSLQSFASEYFGLSKSVNEGKKADSPLLKHVEYLKTAEFFESLLNQVINSDKNKNLTMTEIKGLNDFKKRYLTQLGKQQINTIFSDKNLEEVKNQLIIQLDKLSRIKLESDFQIKISFSAPSEEMSLFLTNQALQISLEKMKQRELNEIIKVENFLIEQKKIAEDNLTHLNKQITEFQAKPENLISLSSKEKVSEYLSDLMVRQNELNLKISENQKFIEYLSSGKNTNRESQLYGNGGRIQSLKLENQIMKNKLSQLQNSVYRVSNMAKSIPVASQFFEDLKKKSEIEFQKFKNLSDAITKAEVQKLSVESRFEISEYVRRNKVHPLVSLSTLILLSLLISQILGSLVIFIRLFWTNQFSNYTNARDVVIINSHDIDPRVIIENSKIKFRLNNSHFTEANDKL